MDLHVGTSGYAYKEWKGSFYPADLPAKGMLHHYGTRFRAVEINSTFYRMPKVSVLESWSDEVPAGFRFVLKAPRQITHVKRLKNADEPTAYFLDVIEALHERFGAILFQLPPNLKKNLPRLDEFLALLPPQRRAAFEFRHPSWFDEDVFGLLHDHGAALCVAEAEEGPEVPFVATADWGYLRLRRPDYGDRELKSWIAKIRDQNWHEAFVFFKHEQEGRGPQLAQQFAELADC